MDVHLLYYLFFGCDVLYNEKTDRSRSHKNYLKIKIPPFSTIHEKGGRVKSYSVETEGSACCLTGVTCKKCSSGSCNSCSIFSASSCCCWLRS